MKQTANRHCPVCDGDAGEVLHTQRFVLLELHPLSSGYNVVSCRACGFVYADTAASQQQFDRFYSALSKYQDPATATGSGESPEDASRLLETASRIASVLPSLDARILDIGCANGGLLEALRRLGYRYLQGLDPAPGCVRTAQSRGLKAAEGSILYLPTMDSPFDCVILCHVLEHVQDLKTALFNVRGLLHNDSLLYAEVPDAARYSDFLYAPFQDFNTEHINHFSRSSLEHLFSRCGYHSTGGGEILLPLPESRFYPAVYGFFKLERHESSVDRHLKDEGLAASIRHYVHGSARLMEEVDLHLQCHLSPDGPFILWGTGQLASKLLSDTVLARLRLLACVDSNPVYHGHTLAGAPILPPAQLKSSSVPIVIASLLHAQSIARRIRELGVTNPLVFLRPEVTVADEMTAGVANWEDAS